MPSYHIAADIGGTFTATVVIDSARHKGREGRQALVNNSAPASAPPAATA